MMIRVRSKSFGWVKSERYDRRFYRSEFKFQEGRRLFDEIPARKKQSRRLSLLLSVSQSTSTLPGAVLLKAVRPDGSNRGFSMVQLRSSSSASSSDLVLITSQTRPGFEKRERKSKSRLLSKKPVDKVYGLWFFGFPSENVIPLARRKR